MASQSLRDFLTYLEWKARQDAIELVARRKLHWSFVSEHYPPHPAVIRYEARLKTAMEAASDADTYCALARGERVPADRLNQRLVNAHRKRVNGDA